MDKGIHNYNRKLEVQLNSVEKSCILEDNKKLILDFEKALQLLENLSVPRRLKLICTMFIIARDYFKKPLTEVTKDDIKDCIREVENRDISPWTKQGYKVTIKKFFKWLEYRDEEAEKDIYPDNVKWIKIHIKSKDKPRMQTSAILTEAETEQLIAVAQLPRDRAFISLLYELGARIGEVGNLTIKDFTKDEYGYIIDLSGKTGHRTPRIVISDPYITEWLNQHPLKNDPNAPAWIYTIKGETKKLNYNALRSLVIRLKTKAGITKRVYPHLFRHSRVTHLLAKGLINEAQAKIYFGWTPDSKMLADYSHLVSQDANKAILAIYGINAKEEKHVERHCPRCHKVNPSDAKFCYYCSSILNETVAFEEQKEKSQIDNILNKLLKDPEVQAKLSKIISGT
jgi:integrase